MSKNFYAIASIAVGGIALIIAAGFLIDLGWHGAAAGAGFSGVIALCIALIAGEIER